MKKIINNPQDVKDQMIEGILFAHSDKLVGVKGTGIILAKNRDPQKIALLSGGGSGHEPADSGFVGQGMLDACVCGPIFEPPSAEAVLQAIELIDEGPGVFVIIKNFEKDVHNFMQAINKAKEKGHKIAYVIVNDDCSIDKASFKKRRRGVAATILIQKMLGAAIADNKSLEELESLAQEFVLASNTLGVALSPTSFPGKTTTAFTLKEDEIYFGIGIHGEAGYRKEPFHSSERLAIELVNKLKNQFRFKENEDYALLVNGLGSTPLMELFVFTNDVRRLLALEGITIQFKKVGNFMTSNDMAGLSLTLLRLKDKTWLDYLNHEVSVYGW